MPEGGGAGLSTATAGFFCRQRWVGRCAWLCRITCSGQCLHQHITTLRKVTVNSDLACGQINVDTGDACQTLKRFTDAFNASAATHALDFKMNGVHVGLLDNGCSVMRKAVFQLSRSKSAFRFSYSSALMSPLPRRRRKISCAVSRGRLRHIAAAPTRQTTKTATKAMAMAMAIKNDHQSPCMPIMFSQYIATLSAVLFCGRLFLRAKWFAHSFNGVGSRPAGPLQPRTPFGHGERFQALRAVTSPEDSPTS